VIPDVFIYSFSLVLFVALLFPSFHDDISNSLRPFIFSFLAVFSQVATGNMCIQYTSSLPLEVKNKKILKFHLQTCRFQFIMRFIQTISDT
jgi:hypothetical protein